MNLSFRKNFDSQMGLIAPTGEAPSSQFVPEPACEPEPE